MIGDIAQLGERGVRNAEVGGSSPPISTKGINRQNFVPEPKSLAPAPSCDRDAVVGLPSDSLFVNLIPCLVELIGQHFFLTSPQKHAKARKCPMSGLVHVCFLASYIGSRSEEPSIRCAPLG